MTYLFFGKKVIKKTILALFNAAEKLCASQVTKLQPTKHIILPPFFPKPLHPTHKSTTQPRPPIPPIPPFRYQMTFPHYLDTKLPLSISLSSSAFFPCVALLICNTNFMPHSRPQGPNDFSISVSLNTLIGISLSSPLSVACLLSNIPHMQQLTVKQGDIL